MVWNKINFKWLPTISRIHFDNFDSPAQSISTLDSAPFSWGQLPKNSPMNQGFAGPLKVTSISNLLFIQYSRSPLSPKLSLLTMLNIFSVFIQVALPTDDQLLHVPPSCAIRCPSSIPSVDRRGHHHRHHNHHRRRGAWNSDLKQHMCYVLAPLMTGILIIGLQMPTELG